MQTAEITSHDRSPEHAAALTWRPVSLVEVLGRANYVTFFTTLAWFVLIAVCVWWAMSAGHFAWDAWPVKLFGVRVAFGFDLPWALCVLLMMWFGLEWAAVPAYLATLFTMLYAQVPPELAVINALHNPLAMAVYFLFYSGRPRGYALRDAKSWLWFGVASLLAAIVSCIGDFIAASNAMLNGAALWASWLGWWMNALLQTLLINAPLIWLCSPAIERFKARWFTRPARDAVSMQKLLLAASLFILCLALFILLDERWTELRTGSILANPLNENLRSQIQAQYTLQSFVIWALALVLATVALSGVIVAGRWGRRLRAQAESETQATRAALHASEAKFRNFFENNPAPMWVYDNTTGEFLEVNHAALREYGYSREEFLRMTIFDIRPIEDVAALKRQMATANHEQEFRHGGEWRHQRKDGSLMYVEVHVSPMRLEHRNVNLGLVYDISPRKQAQLAIEQRARDLQILAAASLEIAGAQTVDAVLQVAADRARELTRANLAVTHCWDPHAQRATNLCSSLAPQYARFKDFQTLPDGSGIYRLVAEGSGVLRLSAAELVQHSGFREHGRHQHQHPPLQGLLAVALRNRTQAAAGALMVSDKAEGEFDAQDEALLVQLTRITSAGLDNLRLTEALRQHMQELEQRVTERTAELDTSNRELDAFAYSVAHDLRAPLRAMHGFADAVREDYGGRLDEAGHGYLDRIVQAASNMDSLIQDLLAYSRVGRDKMVLEGVSLNEVVSEALQDLAQDLETRRARVEVQVPPLKVLAHRATLRQVVMNLVSNAAKFVAPGVTPVIVIRAVAEGEFVELSVSDNGIGIAPEHRERIFNVFERLHGAETYPGTGIGLSIVKKGLARMQGEIQVESGDTGSVFRARLKGVPA